MILSMTARGWVTEDIGVKTRSRTFKRAYNVAVDRQGLI